MDGADPISAAIEIDDVSTEPARHASHPRSAAPPHRALRCVCSLGNRPVRYPAARGGDQGDELTHLIPTTGSAAVVVHVVTIVALFKVRSAGCPSAEPSIAAAMRSRIDFVARIEHAGPSVTPASKPEPCLDLRTGVDRSGTPGVTAPRLRRRR